MERLSQDALKLVASRFKLLANPTRLEILQHICEDELTVGTLVELTGHKQANVSKQLSLLDQAGFVRRRVDGNHVYYALADESLPQLCDLMKGSLMARQDALLSSLEENDT